MVKQELTEETERLRRGRSSQTQRETLRDPVPFLFETKSGIASRSLCDCCIASWPTKLCSYRDFGRWHCEVGCGRSSKILPRALPFFDANGPPLMSSADPESLVRRVCLSIFVLAFDERRPPHRAPLDRGGTSVSKSAAKASRLLCGLAPLREVRSRRGPTQLSKSFNQIKRSSCILQRSMWCFGSAPRVSKSRHPCGLAPSNGQ
jgi:hypothetical protein